MYWRILQLKNLENRLTFDRIMAVSSMCSFFALKVSVRFSQERTHNSGVFQDSSLWKYQKPTKMSTEVKHYCIPSKLIYFSAETSLLTIFLKSCLDLLRSSRSCQNIGRRDSFISGDRWRLSALLSMSLPCLVDLRQMSYALFCCDLPLDLSRLPESSSWQLLQVWLLAVSARCQPTSVSAGRSL